MCLLTNVSKLLETVLLEEKHNSGIYLHICFQVKICFDKLISNHFIVVQQCTVRPFPHPVDIGD